MNRGNNSSIAPPTKKDKNANILRKLFSEHSARKKKSSSSKAKLRSKQNKSRDESESRTEGPSTTATTQGGPQKGSKGKRLWRRIFSRNSTRQQPSDKAEGSASSNSKYSKERSFDKSEHEDPRDVSQWSASKAQSVTEVAEEKTRFEQIADSKPALTRITKRELKWVEKPQKDSTPSDSAETDEAEDRKMEESQEASPVQNGKEGKGAPPRRRRPAQPTTATETEPPDTDQLMRHPDFQLAIRLLRILKRNNYLENALIREHNEILRQFFEGGMSNPTPIVIGLLGKALDFVLDSIWYRMEDLDETIDNEMRMFILNRPNAKKYILDVILFKPEFLPLNWGGKVVAVDKCTIPGPRSPILPAPPSPAVAMNVSKKMQEVDRIRQQPVRNPPMGRTQSMAPMRLPPRQVASNGLPGNGTNTGGYGNAYGQNEPAFGKNAKPDTPPKSVYFNYR